jgi:hypothetical protein
MLVIKRLDRDYRSQGSKMSLVTVKDVTRFLATPVFQITWMSLAALRLMPDHRPDLRGDWTNIKHLSYEPDYSARFGNAPRAHNQIQVQYDGV